nr:hypothetical protein [Tanacetum cinerariifolium]
MHMYRGKKEKEEAGADHDYTYEELISRAFYSLHVASIIFDTTCDAGCSINPSVHHLCEILLLINFLQSGLHGEIMQQSYALFPL